MSSGFPTLTAHTGCDGTAENTVESALMGLRLGADCIEVDLRADPDGRLFLWHDDVVELEGGETIPLPLRLDELRSLERDRKLRLGHPRGRVTTFDELAASLAAAPCHLNLDLKDDRSAELVRAALRATGLERRVHLTGCEIDRVSVARRFSPGVPVYLNTGFGGAQPASLGLPHLRRECEIARAAGCCGLNVHHRFCSPLLVEAAREQGLLVSVWTVAPGDGFARFADMGVDNVTTRHVAELAALRRSLARRLRDDHG